MNTPVDKWSPPFGYVPVESLVAGIAVFAPAAAEARDQPETFVCPNCGAATAYNVAAGGVACEHCGYVHVPEADVVGRDAQEFEFTLDSLDRAARGWGAARRELHCENCGADLTLADGSLTTTCPFCTSSRVVTRAAAQDALRPRFLIPFKIEPERCTEIARAWLGRGWLHPGELARSARLERFTGVYLPFWTFDARVEATWEAEVGYKRKKTVWEDGELKTKTVIEWRWENGQVTVPVDDLLQTGTTKTSANLIVGLYPFDLDALAAYDAGYLAGWQAQAYDIGLEPAWDTAREEMRERARQASRDSIASRHVRNFSMAADFRDETWRYVLLPVYVAAYQFEGRVFQVLINGQTGAVSGQKPVAWWKVWAAIAALLAPGALCGLIGLITIPLGGAGGLGVIAGLILLFVGGVVAVGLFRKAQPADET
ncbi:MAG: hypothetical protein ACE5FI_16520 [Anaerolineales bacterium]